MTTTVAISFPWGLYHATPWGRDVNEAVVEWPPSPWRLLRALFATWRWRSPEVESSTVERVLGALAAPPAYLLPPYVEAHTRHYMPMPDERDRRTKVFDAFMVFERDATALVRWPGELDPEARSVLALLVGGLSYLGRAESICEARLVQDAAAFESLDREGWLEPSGQSGPPETAESIAPDIRLLAPRLPLDVAALTVRTTAVRAGGRTIPQGARWVTYRRPLPAEPRSLSRKVFHRRPTAVRWAFASPARPSIRAAVAMGDVLRQACLSRFGRRFSGSVSPILAGKDASGAPLIDHRHAHYLAVDSDGDRLVDHLVVWAPGGLSPQEVSALADLDRLVGFGHVSDFRPGRLGLEAVGEAGAVAPELTGPCRTWRSFTPFAPPRHAHRRQPWDLHVCEQVEEELQRRDFPAPRSICLVQGDWLSYRRYRIREHLEDGRRAVGIEISFDQEVEGPLGLGSLSHFGLGLFLPAGG